MISERFAGQGLRILIPIIEFGRAGGYRVLSELANSWVREGCKVVFLVDRRTASPYFPTEAEIYYFDAAGNLSVNVEDGVRFKENGNGFGIYCGMFNALNNLALDFDVILANHSLTAIPVFMCRASKSSKFYYIQAYEPEYFSLEKNLKAKFLKWLSWMSYRLPLNQIVNSPIYIGYKAIRAKAWIPPGISRSTFYRRSTQPFLESQDITIGIIGRSEPAKGTAFALEAFEELAKADSGYRLKVAFGNLPAGWSHPRAEIVIPQNDGQLADFYRSIDILVAPGIVQLGACHYPVLEAMACGTPVVHTGYMPGNIENSWIVPIKDSKAIAIAINDIRNMKSIDRLGYLDRAMNEVDSFMWEKVAVNFLTYFRENGAE